MAVATVDGDTVGVLCKVQHIFTSAECADMLIVKGFCEVSATAAVEEYCRRFPMRRILDRGVFSKVSNTMRECDALPSALVSPERARQQHVQEQENILEMVQRSITTSMCRSSTPLRVSRTCVWRTSHEDGFTRFTIACAKYTNKEQCHAS